MPLANFDQYQEMLHSAKGKGYAYPAVNIFNLTSVNAALAAFEEKKSDGILQVSFGAAQFASGLNLKDIYLGAIALANYIHLVADKYSIYVALHTDHCIMEKLDDFVYPLLEESKRRKKNGLGPLFGSHMFDGSTITLKENLALAEKILARCAELGIILEVETGVVGGEEDGVAAEKDAQLYSTQADMLAVYETLGNYSQGTYMLAATFGNVHGVYKPGSVKLKPSILADGQKIIKEKYDHNNFFNYVFHGGSGSSLEEIRETIKYGVVKMNVDTDNQYAFTRPVADHFFKNYDGLLKVDGEVGSKKAYDPRGYLKLAELGMKERVMKSCDDLLSSGNSIYKKNY